MRSLQCLKGSSIPWRRSVMPIVSLQLHICTAAKAALMLVRKYYALTDDNEVYWIAIGLFHHNSLLSAYSQVVSTVLAMCPDKKIKWFEKNLDWHVEDQEEAHRIVFHCWEQTYAGETKLRVDNRHNNHQPKVHISVLSAHPKNLSKKTELLWQSHSTSSPNGQSRMTTTTTMNPRQQTWTRWMPISAVHQSQKVRLKQWVRGVSSSTGRMPTWHVQGWLRWHSTSFQRPVWVFHSAAMNSELIGAL